MSYIVFDMKKCNPSSIGHCRCICTIVRGLLLAETQPLNFI